MSLIEGLYDTSYVDIMKIGELWIAERCQLGMRARPQVRCLIYGLYDISYIRGWCK
jgi:hypothetical protein